MALGVPEGEVLGAARRLVATQVLGYLGERGPTGGAEPRGAGAEPPSFRGSVGNGSSRGPPSGVDKAALEARYRRVVARGFALAAFATSTQRDPDRWLRVMFRDLSQTYGLPVGPIEGQLRALALRSLTTAQIQLVRCLRREKDSLRRRLGVSATGRQPVPLLRSGSGPGSFSRGGSGPLSRRSSAELQGQ